jgi:hypothetical protein
MPFKLQNPSGDYTGWVGARCANENIGVTFELDANLIFLIE